MAERVVHIAGKPLTVGTKARQLCGWCGERLIVHDENTFSTDARGPRFFAEGELVEVVKNGVRQSQTIVPHENGAELPAGACAAPPPSLRVVR